MTLQNDLGHGLRLAARALAANRCSIGSWSCSPNLGRNLRLDSPMRFTQARSLSTSFTRYESHRKLQSDKIRISAEELQKKQSPDELGHNTTIRDGVKPKRERTLAAFSMAGKTCVVTGAARGLGNLMARTFLEAGASKIAFLDLSKEEAQKAASDAGHWLSQSDSVAESGSLDLIGHNCDISNEDSVKEAFAEIHKRWGQIDVVVNSAGIVENFPAEEYATSKYRRLMQINLDGAWFVANEAARYMIKDRTRGSIVLIASMSASIVNFPQLQAPYNASKAGVKHLASSLAVEWAKYNIRVNSLSPGYVLTDLTRVMIEKSDHGKMLKREWESRIPLGRMAVPEDLKGAAVFLASDASKYVTASDLLVDGGYCAV